MFLSFFFVIFMQSLYYTLLSNAFQVKCPSSVNVGESVDCTWIRTNGDDSSFGLLLHPTKQDQSGTVVATITDTTKDTDTFPVTFDHPDQFLIEVVPPDTTQRKDIKASSSTITAVSADNASSSSSNSGDTGNSGNSGNSGNTGTSAGTSSTSISTSTSTSTGISTSTSTGTSTSTSSSVNSIQSTQAVTGVFNPNLPEKIPASTPTTVSADPSPLVGSNGNGNSSTSTASPLSSPNSEGNINNPNNASPSSSNSNSKSKLPLILGLTFGLLFLLLLLGALFFVYTRRKRRAETSQFFKDKLIRQGRGGGLMFDLVSPRSGAEDNQGNYGTGNGDSNMAEKGVGIGAGVAAGARTSRISNADARSVSVYSYRTSRTGSIDPNVALLWQNARERVSGLSRSDTTATNGGRGTIPGTPFGTLGRVEEQQQEREVYRGYAFGGFGNSSGVGAGGLLSPPAPVMLGRQGANANANRVSATTISSGSSEPSVFYTAVPTDQTQAAPPKTVTIKERLAPWFTFPPRPAATAELRSQAQTNSMLSASSGGSLGSSLGSLFFGYGGTSSNANADANFDSLSIDQSQIRPPPDVSLPTSVYGTWRSGDGVAVGSGSASMLGSSVSVSVSGLGSDTSTNSHSNNASINPFASPLDPNPNFNSSSGSESGSGYTFPTQRILGLFPPSAATWTATASNWAANWGVGSGNGSENGNTDVNANGAMSMGMNANTLTVPSATLTPFGAGAGAGVGMETETGMRLGTGLGAGMGIGRNPGLPTNPKADLNANRIRDSQLSHFSGARAV